MKNRFLIFLLFLTHTLFAQINLQNGLIAYYPFNGNANDESGNNLNGTISGVVTLTTDRFNNPNKAYYFNGSINDFIKVNHDSKLNFNNSFTISAWVKLEGTLSGVNQRFQILNKGRDVIDGYNLSYDYTDYITTTVPGSSFGFTNNYPNPNNNNWGEIISVYPYSTAGINGGWNNISGVVDVNEGTAKLYVNGLLMGSKTISSVKIENTEPLIIGRHRDPQQETMFPYPFKGKIDDIKIYNRALTLNEVKELYSQDGCSKPVIEIINNQLTTVSIAGANYQWSINGNVIANANSNVLTDLLQVGTYSLNVSHGSCTVTADPFYIGPQPTPTTVTSVVTVTITKIIIIDEFGNTISGVNNREETQDISIFPNPAFDYVKIKSEKLKIGKIEVLYTNGIKMLESINENQIQVSTLTPGIYILNIYDNAGLKIKTAKLIVQ